MIKVRVFNGPNLNLLGQREPGQYGQRSLADIMQELEKFAADCGLQLDHMQTNSEGKLVDAIQQAGKDGIDYIIINPAGYTHTSVAIRDAFLSVSIPFIEVHLSNIHAREDFRSKSYFSDLAAGVISGLGAIGYELALQAAMQRLQN